MRVGAVQVFFLRWIGNCHDALDEDARGHDVFGIDAAGCTISVT